MNTQNRFVPRKRTGVDGKQWWVAYDTIKQKYSTLTIFGQHLTKKSCQHEIDYLIKRGVI